MLQAPEVVKVEDVESPQGMTMVAGSTFAAARGPVEFGLGYEQLARPSLKQHEESKRMSASQSQYLQVPAYAIEHPNRGAFVSLATQDFLQPLERGGRDNSGNAASKAVAQPMNGEIPLQLSSRIERSDASESQLANESCSTRMQFPNLGMQYGYVEHPHPHAPKAGLEAGQQSVVAVNRHWQQQGLVNNTNKRPRSAQSEGDETDAAEDRRKMRGEGLNVRDDANSRSIDVKSNTSRSKHSATEQRRRSKINDRFQMLRDLLPHGDQKRDKASFLLEVIEYIQSLQERVKKYEAMEKGGQHERLKPAVWDANTSASMKDPDAARDKSSYMSPINLHDTGKTRTFGSSVGVVQNNRSVQVTHPQERARRPQQPQAGPSVPELRIREDLTKDDHQSREKTSVSTSKAENRQHQRIEASSRNTPLTSRQAPAEAPTQSQDRTPAGVKSTKNEESLPVKQGVISLSTAYSQGLLEALTTALHSSGLDLSKANISVQIELGKPAENKHADVESSHKQQQQQ